MQYAGVRSAREGVVSNSEMKKVSPPPRNSPRRVDVPILQGMFTSLTAPANLRGKPGGRDLCPPHIRRTGHE